MKLFYSICSVACFFQLLSSNAMASHKNANPTCDLSVPSFTQLVVGKQSVPAPGSGSQAVEGVCSDIKSKYIDGETSFSDLDCSWTFNTTATTGSFNMAGASVYGTNYTEYMNVIVYKKVPVTLAEVKALKCKKITECYAESGSANNQLQELNSLAQQYDCK